MERRLVLEDDSMTATTELALRTALGWEFGRKRSLAPGSLAVWSIPQTEQTAALKEVMAIIRPERWAQTKVRLQRLRLLAGTQQRVLGRGRERGLRYLPRQGASSQAAIRYLPKRMISWIVEDAQVEPLVKALLDTNQTGQLGDGKIFVLPVEGAIRIRTGDRGLEALKAQQPFEMVIGHASRQ